MTDFLDGTGLTVAYQPVVDLDSGDVVGYERRSPAGPSRPSRCWTPRATPAGSRNRLGEEEWSVVVVGPHYAGALVSRQVGPDPADGYDDVVTHSRDLVVEAGRSLPRHVAPSWEAPA